MVEDREQGIVEKNGTEEKQTDQPLVFICILRHKKISPMEKRDDVMEIYEIRSNFFNILNLTLETCICTEYVNVPYYADRNIGF